jgi:hypothetical protein
MCLPKKFDFRICISDDNTIYHAEYVDSLNEEFCTEEEKGHEGYIISWRDEDINTICKVGYLLSIAELAIRGNAWIIIGNSVNNKN